MEILRRYVAVQPSRYAAYVALQVALMRRYLARGGTLEDFCSRLAPIFHRRYAPILLGEPDPRAGLLASGTPRVRQECSQRGGGPRPDPHRGDGRTADAA